MKLPILILFCLSYSFGQAQIHRASYDDTTSKALSRIRSKNPIDGDVVHVYMSAKLEDGLWLIHYGDDTSRRAMSCRVVNGKKHGYYQKFERNGMLSVTGYYCENEQVGLWTFVLDSSGNHMKSFIKGDGMLLILEHPKKANNLKWIHRKRKKYFRKNLKTFQKELEEGKAPCFSV